MKKMLLALAVVMTVSICCAKEYAGASDWPCEVKADDLTFQIFEPSVELFEDNNLRLRSAVSIKDAKDSAETEPAYGCVWLTALSSNDTVNRKVTCDSLRVTKFKCPDKEEEETAYAAALQSALGKVDMVLDMDYVLRLEKEENFQTRDEGEFKNDPPRIICVTNATVLVQIDGAPIMRKLDDAGKYEAVANTPYCLVFDTGKKCYYLKGYTYWLSAPTLQSPFLPASGVPEAVKEYGSSLELCDEEKESFSDVLNSGFPQVIVTTEPTELICIDGTPKYKNVEGTDIMYAENTENDLFYCATDARLYVLLSGRWYAHIKDDQWEYVAPDKLPSGFYKMTADNGKESALVSIKGTKEAREAVADSYVPQTVKVARKAEEVPEVVYDGTPQFKEIPEAYPVAYAVNTPHDIIRVNDRYYLCENAVWYESLDPATGWTVCINVPSVIYTIPPAYPVYHVRYVRVYNYTPDYVYVGYYPGYVGCYVNNGVVVYGTGYRYAPWVGTYYYPWPATFGFGVSYSLGFGWGFNIGWGAPIGWVGFGFSWSNWRWGYHHHPHWHGGHCGWWGPGCGPRHHHHVYKHHGRGCGNLYRSGDHCPGSHGGNTVGPWKNGKVPAGRYLADEPVKSYNRQGTPANSRVSTPGSLPTSNLRADKNGNLYNGRTGSRVGTPASGSRVGTPSSGSAGSRVGTPSSGSASRVGTPASSGSRVGTPSSGSASRVGTPSSGSASRVGTPSSGTRVGTPTSGSAGSRVGTPASGTRVGTPSSGTATPVAGRVGASTGSGTSTRVGTPSSGSSNTTVPMAGRVGASTGSSGSTGTRTATPANQTRKVNNPSTIRNGSSGGRSGSGTIRSGSGSGSGARQGVRSSSFTTPSVPSYSGSAVRSGASLGSSSGARVGSGLGSSSGVRMGSGGGARMGGGSGVRMGGGGARMGGGGGARMGGGMGGARMGGGGRGGRR